MTFYYICITNFIIETNYNQNINLIILSRSKMETIYDFKTYTQFILLLLYSNNQL